MTVATPTPTASPAGTAEERQPAKLSWSLSGHATRLLTLALAGLVMAILTQRPVFAAVAAPAVLLLITWPRSRPGQIRIGLRVSAFRLGEGEQAQVTVAISETGGYRADLVLRPADMIVLSDQAKVVRDGQAATIQFVVTQWGRRRPGNVEIVLRDRFRLLEGRVTVPLPWLDCYPAPAILQTRVVLRHLLNWLGEHSSRTRGEGIEFAGVREFVPGDAQRRINWPATTRRGRLQINTFATERSQNVVLITDVSSDVGEPGSSALDLALRGAAGAAQSYLAARDRVGYISFGGPLTWLPPGSGPRQLMRIMTMMLATESIGAQRADLDRLPRAALPPGALIMVFTPLLSRPLIRALRDLRERGFAVLIVDVLNAEPPAGSDTAAGMARRIWRMEQQAIRFSLRELGIPVAHWDGQQPLDEPLAPFTRRVMVGPR
jgi:uncharacterized protein (DUF58 family)